MARAPNAPKWLPKAFIAQVGEASHIGRAGVGEKSRARTSVTSQSTVWSIEAESGSGAVFRPERSFMMKAPKWVRFEDRHSILNSAIHPELGSSAQLIHGIDLTLGIVCITK